MSQQQTGFKDSTSLTKWVKWLLYAQIIMAFLAIISGLFEYRLLLDFKNGVYASQEFAAAAGVVNDARQSIIGIIQMLLFIVSGILILKWIYRANYNARQLGAQDMEFKPGWSIGWYFIPFANLWKPYQAMEEIWQASSNPQDWADQRIPALLPWWWFFWITSNILGNVSFNLSMEAKGIPSFITANILTQLADVFKIPLCFIFLAIVNGVFAMQMFHAKAERPSDLSP